MHRFTTALVTSALFVFPIQSFAQEDTSLETPAQKAGYAVGLQVGNSLRQQGAEGLDIDAMALAIKDVMAGAQPRLNNDEIRAAFEALQAEQQAAAAKKGELALENGQAFLEQNKSAEGVVVTESGLQYRIETEGSGDSPKPDQSVTVHYEGRLLDGSVFDSSYQRGAPASFPVGGVIRGWTEALQLMKPGAKWEVWIPSELAYGPRGAGADIGPNETLNFTIELISVDG